MHSYTPNVVTGLTDLCLGSIIQEVRTVKTIFCTIPEKKLGLFCSVLFQVSLCLTQTGQYSLSDVTQTATWNEVCMIQGSKYVNPWPKTDLLNQSTVTVQWPAQRNSETRLEEHIAHGNVCLFYCWGMNVKKKNSTLNDVYISSIKLWVLRLCLRLKLNF